MKAEGVRRLKPGDRVWWRYRSIREGTIRAIFHRGGRLSRIEIDQGGRVLRRRTARRLYYVEPPAQQFVIPGAAQAQGRLIPLPLPPQQAREPMGHPEVEQLPLV